MSLSNSSLVSEVEEPEELRKILDDCLSHILHFPKFLKLGYNFQCDINQLADSYKYMECFRHYEMLLDIRNVFGEAKGDLSGLTKVGICCTFSGVSSEERRRAAYNKGLFLISGNKEYGATGL